MVYYYSIMVLLWYYYSIMGLLYVYVCVSCMDNDTFGHISVIMYHMSYTYTYTCVYVYVYLNVYLILYDTIFDTLWYLMIPYLILYHTLSYYIWYFIILYSIFTSFTNTTQPIAYGDGVTVILFVRPMYRIGQSPNIADTVCKLFSVCTFTNTTKVVLLPASFAARWDALPAHVPPKGGWRD